MGDFVDEVLKRYVTPLMRDAGFRRSGAVYRLVAPSGDYSFFDVRRHKVSEANSFLLQFSIAIKPHIEWLNHVSPRSPNRPVGPERSLVWWQVEPPGQWVSPGHRPSRGHALWGMQTDHDIDGCGAALADLLREQELPKVLGLLDRQKLRDALGTRSPAWLSRLRSCTTLIVGRHWRSLRSTTFRSTKSRK